MDMRVGYFKDAFPAAPPRVEFWDLGKSGVVELMSCVGILAILVGIVAGTILW